MSSRSPRPAPARWKPPSRTRCRAATRSSCSSTARSASASMRSARPTADARRIDVTLGRAVEPDLVRDELAKEKGKDGAKAILIQHNETSTGVLNPIKEISEVVRESGKLFIVDSVSGAGAAELEIDEWGIDRSEERRVGKEGRSRWSPY